MIYFRDGEILVRDMMQSDAQIITNEEIAQGWNQTVQKYELRLRDQAEGKAVSLVAEYQGHVAGYVNVYPNAKEGAFAHQGYPEIVDLGVLVKYRHKGIGTVLMDVAEKIAAQYAKMVYLGVGLHEGYGHAQRMYVKRGYVPDGSGVWYGEQVCPPYTACHNDDDLVLYLSKQLCDNE